MKLSQSQSQEPAPQAPAQPPTSPTPRQWSSAPPTLEDLLRLKRAERPAPEFWAAFDEQLKQRQLAAAIQEKRTWRQALPEMLRIALVIPASAAAALAIGLIVWRNSEPAAIQPALLSATAGNTGAANLVATTNSANAPLPPAAQTVPASAQTTRTADAPARDNGIVTVALAATQTETGTKPAARGNTTDGFATLTARAAAAIPEFALAAFVGARPSSAKTISPSAFLTMPVGAGDLAAVKTSVEDAVKNSQPATVAATASAEEPPPAKTDDDTPSQRRARLLAYMESRVTPASATDDNPRALNARNRVASRLTDKVVTDTISRFDATGDSLSIKF